MMPMMSSEEIKLFEKYLSQATNYLEYGSGGSTVFASKFENIKKIKSIESDSEWALKIQKETRTEMNYINLGEIGGCGTPIDLSTKHLWHKYSQNYSDEFDLVLIDGRFRVACFLDICLKGNPIILFHDFLDRPEYHIVLDFCQVIDFIDTLVVLKINEELDLERIKELYSTYSLNSD
jgi:hypothetical protein